MALGTPVLHSETGATGTVATTASFTPDANSVLYAFSASRAGAAVPSTITDSLGSTWTLVTGSNVDGGNLSVSLHYLVIGGSPSAMTVTATSTSANQTAISVVGVTGADDDMSNFQLQTEAAGDPSVTLSALQSGSGVLAWHGQNAGALPTGTPSGYTSLHNNLPATNLRHSAWYDLTSPGLTLSWTTNGAPSIGLAIEVREDGGSPGAIDGSASLAFTGAGTLRGAGRLSGAAAATFTNTGNLRGLAPITGSASMAFTTSGDGILIGFLTGTSNLAFTTDGTLLGTGALTASIFPQFSVSGHMVSDSFITGSAAVAFTTSGTLRGVGRLTGTSALAFTTSGTVDTPDSLFGSSLLTFTPSGTLRGAGRLIGSCSLTFTPTGVGTRNRFATGSAHLTFTVSGDGERIFAPYEVTSGTSPDDIFGTGSGTGLFLYFETSGTGPDEIYEEN